MKTLLAGILGGFILTVWGMAAWLIIPLHEGSTHRIDNEKEVVAVMKSAMGDHAVYLFPMPAEETDAMTEEEKSENMRVWEEKIRRGPMGMIVYRPGGMAPFEAAQALIGLFISIISALFAAWFLARSTAVRESYIVRVSYCGMLGIFASFVTHVAYWNWMYFPFDYTSAMVLDTVVGWVLAGLAIAAIIKPLKVEST